MLRDTANAHLFFSDTQFKPQENKRAKIFPSHVAFIFCIGLISLPLTNKL